MSFNRTSSKTFRKSMTSTGSRRGRSSGGIAGVRYSEDANSGPPKPASSFYEALLQLKAQEKKLAQGASPMTRDLTPPTSAGEPISPRWNTHLETDGSRWSKQQEDSAQKSPVKLKLQSVRPCSPTMLAMSREVNVAHESLFEILDKTADRLAETRVLCVFLGVISSVPAAMAMIGVKHLEDCPVQPKIPVYLLVGGCFGLLKMLSLLWRQIRIRRYRKMGDVDATVAIDDDDDYDDDNYNGGAMTSKSYMLSQLLLSAFLGAWFVAGNCWVLSVWWPNFRHLLDEPNNWCDRTTYVFAFTQIVSCHVIICSSIVLLTIAAVCRQCSRYFSRTGSS